MTLPLLNVREVPLTRRILCGTDGSDGDEWVEVTRGLVATASVTLQLVIEGGDHGTTVDGWLGADGLVWHVRGAEDVLRDAVIGPPAHLCTTVARMVALGARSAPGDRLRIPAAALQDQLAGRPGPLPGGIARAWSLSWRTDAAEQGMSLVDQGDGAALWAVAGGDETELDLLAVTPLDVWLRLAAVPQAAQPAVTSAT